MAVWLESPAIGSSNPLAVEARILASFALVTSLVDKKMTVLPKKWGVAADTQELESGGSGVSDQQSAGSKQDT